MTNGQKFQIWAVSLGLVCATVLVALGKADESALVAIPTALFALFARSPVQK